MQQTENEGSERVCGCGGNCCQSAAGREKEVKVKGRKEKGQTVCTIKLVHGQYTGSVEWIEEHGFFYGRILGIDDIVSYSAKEFEAVKSEFLKALGVYENRCQFLNKKPQVSKNA
jgi:Fe-S-cluster containining protein